MLKTMKVEKSNDKGNEKTENETIIDTNKDVALGNNINNDVSQNEDYKEDNNTQDKKEEVNNSNSDVDKNKNEENTSKEDVKKDKEENTTSNDDNETSADKKDKPKKGFISKSIKFVKKIVVKIFNGIKNIIGKIGNFFKGLFKKDVEVKNVTLLSSKDNSQSKTEDASIFSSIWDSIWDIIWDVIYYLGWYRRAEKPSNPGNQETVDKVINYEIINYINDVSLENAEVLMTSDMKGNYTSAYTYGLDRISVDNSKVLNNPKIDPLYYLYDGRGSVSELVNRSGEVTSNYNYEAFGTTDHLGYLGNVGIHYENYYGYNGENYNERSGLQYLRARYYEPDTGTFLTRDSYLGNIMNPLSQNRYSYAENNPIMNVDPSGHFANKLWSGVKKVGSSIGKGISNLATKVVELVDKIPSPIKQIFTGTGSKLNKNTNTSKSTTNSLNYTYTEIQKFRTTANESRFNLAKTSTKNTTAIVQQQSTPRINTINYPNSIVRENIVSIQKSCEGTSAVGSQSYAYKEQVVSAGKEKEKGLTWGKVGNGLLIGLGATITVAGVIIAAPIIGTAAGIMTGGAAIGGTLVSTLVTGAGYGVAAGVGTFGANRVVEATAGKNLLRDNVFGGNEQAFNNTELLFSLAGTGMVIGAAGLPQTSSTANTNNDKTGSQKSDDLLDELSSSGVKYSEDGVLAVTKTADGKLVWLENGNSKAGMQHILDHADDFARKGIAQNKIQDLVMESLTNGKIVGYQGKGTGRPIYEVMFEGQIYHTSITTGNNGFIVGANPTTWQ